MTHSQATTAMLAELIQGIFSEVGDFVCIPEPETRGDRGRPDLNVVSKSLGRSYQFDVTIRERVTPQIADSLFKRVEETRPPGSTIPLVFAPVISPRVAEIARRHGISYVDCAGNCRIVDSASGLLVLRSGIPNKRPAGKQTMTDPFSPKSSRIVRAMLSEPMRGWQVSELAKHPDVEVSMGLASKVKAALVREGFVAVRERLLHLKRPLELLADWTKRYPGPASERSFYLRGDTSEVEGRIADWCDRRDIEYALARFSAGWRLAPEVRYSVASVYVDENAFLPDRFESLRIDCGAREVESGANLVLLTPFDQSVFVGRVESPEPTTSALQTYLDLQSVTGRSVEAAEAVFEKHLRGLLDTAGLENKRA